MKFFHIEIKWKVWTGCSRFIIGMSGVFLQTW